MRTADQVHSAQTVVESRGSGVCGLDLKAQDLALGARGDRRSEGADIGVGRAGVNGECQGASLDLSGVDCMLALCRAGYLRSTA